MKLLVACDGRDFPVFLTALVRVVTLQNVEAIFAHVVDTAFEDGWQQMAGHHWLGRRPERRETARFREAAVPASRAILEEALALTAGWPTASRRPVVLTGNPERELVRLAQLEAVDVLAVGQHRIELGPHALGRCARYVIDHAPCTVVLVRPESIRAAAADLLGDRLESPRRPFAPRPQR